MPTTALVRIFTIVTLALAILPARSQVDTTQTATPTGVISGQVVDMITQQPIAGGGH
jgi:hypothetical protein